LDDWEKFFKVEGKNIESAEIKQKTKEIFSILIRRNIFFFFFDSDLFSLPSPS